MGVNRKVCIFLCRECADFLITFLIPYTQSPILYASKEIRIFFIENFPRTIDSASFFHYQILLSQSFEVFLYLACWYVWLICYLRSCHLWIRSDKFVDSSFCLHELFCVVGELFFRVGELFCVVRELFFWVGELFWVVGELFFRVGELFLVIVLDDVDDASGRVSYPANIAMAYMLVMNYSILLLIIVVIVNITMIHSGVLWIVLGGGLGMEILMLLFIWYLHRKGWV